MDGHYDGCYEEPDRRVHEEQRPIGVRLPQRRGKRCCRGELRPVRAAPAQTLNECSQILRDGETREIRENLGRGEMLCQWRLVQQGFSKTSRGSLERGVYTPAVSLAVVLVCLPHGAWGVKHRQVPQFIHSGKVDYKDDVDSRPAEIRKDQWDLLGGLVSQTPQHILVGELDAENGVLVPRRIRLARIHKTTVDNQATQANVQSGPISQRNLACTFRENPHGK